MKTKFLLTLLTLNGIFWGINSASANALAATTNDRDIAKIGDHIAELLNFDPSSHTLVEFAISRALLAQTLNECKNVVNTRDRIPAKNSRPPAQPKVTRGRIAKPIIPSIEQPIGKVAQPTAPSTAQPIGKVEAIIPSRRSHTAGARG
jgi:hypothetical protein